MRVNKVDGKFAPYAITIHIDTANDEAALIESMSVLRMALHNLGPLTMHEGLLRDIAANMVNNITREVAK